MSVCKGLDTLFEMQNPGNARRGQSDTLEAKPNAPDQAQNSGTVSSGLSTLADHAQSTPQDLTTVVEEVGNTAGSSGLSQPFDQAEGLPHGSSTSPPPGPSAEQTATGSPTPPNEVQSLRSFWSKWRPPVPGPPARTRVGSRFFFVA
jgi:hypothetical protein